MWFKSSASHKSQPEPQETSIITFVYSQRRMGMICIGIMENRMETTIYRDYIGIMEKKMETTI